MPKRFNKNLFDLEGKLLHWVQCSTVGCRKWHRLNYEPDEGSPFACNHLGGDPSGCRNDYKGNEGESEDEYWERHSEDVAEVEDEDAIVVGAEETIGEKKAYIEKLKALSSDEKTTAKSFADTILALKAKKSNTSQAHTFNRALRTAKELSIYVSDKMTSSKFTGKNKDRDLRAVLEGIWLRCNSGQQITLVSGIIGPVEKEVKKAEGEADKGERAVAASSGANNLALLAHAWVDLDLSNLRLDASKRVDGHERPRGLQVGMVEYAALKYKDFITAAMNKKQSYKNEFSTLLHGDDCFEATKHIDPQKADVKIPPDVEVCKWVKSSLTTLANRHGQLKAKVEASGRSKTTADISTWERAYERSKTGNAADPIALYLYLVWDGKDLGTFSAVLDDGLLSHGKNSVQPGGRHRSGTGTTGSDNGDSNARAVSIAQAISMLQPSEDVRLAQKTALLAQAHKDDAQAAAQTAQAAAQTAQAAAHTAQAAASVAQAAATSATATLAVLKDRDAIRALVDPGNGETEAEVTEMLRKKARQNLLG